MILRIRFLEDGFKIFMFNVGLRIGYINILNWYLNLIFLFECYFYDNDI